MFISKNSGCVISLAILLAVGVPAGPVAASEAAPQAVVDSFHQVLLDTMTNGRSLGPKGRFAELEPVISQAFDMPLITRAVVGSEWNKLSTEQQTRLSVAFERFEVAQFADLFDSYQGQRFRNLGAKPAAGEAFVVTTVMEGEGWPGIRFDYTVHRVADGWRIEDIRFDAWLSVVDRRSAELRDVLQRRGFEALVSRLERHTQAVLDRADNVGSSHLADLRSGEPPAYNLPIPLP